MRRAFPIFAVCLSVLWIVWAFDYGLWVRRGPGGGFFPFIGGVITLVFSLAYLWEGRKNTAPVSINLKFIYPIAALLAVFLASYLIGMVPCLFLYIFLWLWRYEKYALSLSLYVSAGTMLVLYGIFVYWLSVPLPRGILGNAILG